MGSKGMTLREYFAVLEFNGATSYWVRRAPGRQPWSIYRWPVGPFPKLASNNVCLIIQQYRRPCAERFSVRTSRCARCSRKLVGIESVARGIGPESITKPHGEAVQIISTDVQR